MLTRHSMPMEKNQVYVKKIGDMYKVTVLNEVRVAGWECSKPDVFSSYNSSSNAKLSRNLFRAKNTIFEYARCNDWDFFFTGTLSPEKNDRYDISTFKDRWRNFIKYQQRKGNDIKFLLIPEKHKDGAWHFHGLLRGIPDCDLRSFGVRFNWLSFEKKFGFNSLERIKNHEAVSKYLTKYITKDLDKSVSEVGMHLYYVSQGLNKAELIKKGTFSKECPLQPDFENDFCRIFNLSDLNLIDKFIL